MNAVSKPSEIDVSCRLPLLVLFISAAVWLVLGSIFALLGSLIFHKPELFSNSFTFSYGHLVSVRTTSFLYGAGIQPGIAFTIWLFCRLGRTPLAQPILVTVGAALWNLGVTVGVIGIFVGDATGFETLEIPRYAALIVFLGYLIVATLAVVTLHGRRERQLYVSLDLFDGQSFAVGFSSAWRDASSHRVVVFRESANRLVWLGGNWGHFLLRSQTHESRVEQPLSGAVHVLDVDPFRQLDRCSQQRASSSVDAGVEHGWCGLNSHSRVNIRFESSRNS